MDHEIPEQLRVDRPPTLVYRSVERGRQASRFGRASLFMAGITVAWLVPPYLCWRGLLLRWPFDNPRGGPISEALMDTVLWPVGITFVLGIVGMCRPRRPHRWLGAVAIGVVCVALPALVPGLWR